jgi:hypothetical protein
MITVRSHANLQGDVDRGEADLKFGDVVTVPDDHPYIGLYLVPVEQALHERTKDDLIETAKALGVTGTSNMNKDELVSAIEEAAADGVAPVEG